MTRPTTAQLNAAYDQFNFWYDKAKKLDEELAKAEDYIAELEPRTVTVKLPSELELRNNEVCSVCAGNALQVIESKLTADGIKWEAD